MFLFLTGVGLISHDDQCCFMAKITSGMRRQ
jgi:hypothetical protein